MSFNKTLTIDPGERWYLFSQSALDELIANERGAEREACALIVDGWANSLSSEPEMVEIAKQIRARGVSGNFSTSGGSDV